MTTIKGLIERHSAVPGDIKVRQKSWPRTEWFRPFFSVELYPSGRGWYGLASDADKVPTFDDDNHDWQIYPAGELSLVKLNKQTEGLD